MKSERNLCQAITKKGFPCKLKASNGSEFCGYHDEKLKIRKFFINNRDKILGFLLGASTDPIANDIYDLIRERTGFKHFVLPVIDDYKNFHKQSDDFKLDSPLTLYRSIPYILNINYKDVRTILGEPNYESGRNINLWMTKHKYVVYEAEANKDDVYLTLFFSPRQNDISLIYFEVRRKGKFAAQFVSEKYFLKK